jgi:hypothetical protein
VYIPYAIRFGLSSLGFQFPAVAVAFCVLRFVSGGCGDGCDADAFGKLYGVPFFNNSGSGFVSSLFLRTKSGDYVVAGDGFARLPLCFWRIKEELGRSGFVTAPDLIGFFCCLSFVFVCGTDVSGGALGRFVYLERSGWFLVSTYSGGLHPLLGVLYTGVLRLVLFVALDPFYTGKEMVVGHLAWPVRSMTTRHVGFPDMLLLVPLQNFEAASSGRWPASGHLLQSPATRMTGSSLQGLDCNSLVFQGCLCKLYDVNYQKFM